MKHFLYLIFSVLCLPAFAQGLYDVDHVTEIRITFTQSNWDQILDSYYAADNDQRLLATVSVNGVVYDSAGVQFKGNSTYSPNNAKNPLNIKLDYTKKQNYQGWETLKLANGKNDPSAIREVMSYELLRNYMEAPLSNFAKVFVNDKLYGMFSSSESIDGDFQERYLYASDENTRVKCNPQSVQNGGSSLQYFGEDTTDYYNYYEMKSDNGWAELATFCDQLSNNAAEIEKYLDVDRAIWMLAFNNVCVNLDSYTGSFRQNYYMIKDDNGRMKPVVWDLNMSYGAFSMINNGGGGGNSLSKLQQLNPYLREGDSGWPLLKMILGNPTYKKMYIAHCKTILEEQINTGLYSERGQKFQDLIKEDIEADVNSAYTYAKFISNLKSTVSSGGGGGGMGSFCGITELMESRKNYLSTHVAFTAQAPVISELNYPAEALANEPFYITAKISDATNAVLAYRDLPSAIFTKVSMSDDGLHGDGAAGDGIYGASFPDGQNLSTQFYIYSENNNAGVFLPARAEHEFFNIGIRADGLVINELMASNSKTAQDQDGGYDDWIELYNGSESAINLDGYYISDKLDAPDKFKLPNVTIPAKGYLIIWADEEQEQAGVHTNFKLSASGESIILSNPNLGVIDQITFPALGEDVAYGRSPNGTGAFKELPATFNANNDGMISTDDLTLTDLQVYPNPFDDVILIKTQEKISSIRIFDVSGRTVYQSLSGKNAVSASHLSPGVYFLELNHQKVVKLIK